MERRLSKKIQTHCDNLKDDILKWMEENNLELTHNESGVKFMDKFEIFMANYENITFTKEDFLKRKRIKNMVPQQDNVLRSEQTVHSVPDGKNRVNISAEHTLKEHHMERLQLQVKRFH